MWSVVPAVHLATEQRRIRIGNESPLAVFESSSRSISSAENRKTSSQAFHFPLFPSVPNNMWVASANWNKSSGTPPTDPKFSLRGATFISGRSSSSPHEPPTAASADQTKFFRSERHRGGWSLRSASVYAVQKETLSALFAVVEQALFPLDVVAFRGSWSLRGGFRSLCCRHLLLHFFWAAPSAGCGASNQRGSEKVICNPERLTVRGGGTAHGMRIYTLHREEVGEKVVECIIFFKNYMTVKAKWTWISLASSMRSSHLSLLLRRIAQFLNFWTDRRSSDVYGL